MVSEKRTWQNINIDDKKFVICVIKRNNSLCIFLTDLLEIWTESLTREKILNKCQILNPLLSIDSLDYDEIVTNMLDNIPEHITKATVEEIKLHKSVEGITFKFTLNLSKGSPEDYWENITKPLCSVSAELSHRQEILLDLIKKKDEEIAEYKAENAKLIRKNIETKPSSEDIFKVKPETDFINYTTAFKQLTEFYYDMDAKAIKIEPDSSPTNSVIDREGITGSIKQEDDDSKEQVSLDATPVCSTSATQENATQSNRKNKIKNTQTKTMTKRSYNITNNSSITRHSHKKTKKTLNDFIL